MAETQSNTNCLNGIHMNAQDIKEEERNGEELYRGKEEQSVACPKKRLIMRYEEDQENITRNARNTDHNYNKVMTKSNECDTECDHNHTNRTSCTNNVQEIYHIDQNNGAGTNYQDYRRENNHNQTTSNDQCECINVPGLHCYENIKNIHESDWTKIATYILVDPTKQLLYHKQLPDTSIIPEQRTDSQAGFIHDNPVQMCNLLTVEPIACSTKAVCIEQSHKNCNQSFKATQPAEPLDPCHYIEPVDRPLNLSKSESITCDLTKLEKAECFSKHRSSELSASDNQLSQHHSLVMSDHHRNHSLISIQPDFCLPVADLTTAEPIQGSMLQLLHEPRDCKRTTAELIPPSSLMPELLHESGNCKSNDPSNVHSENYPVNQQLKPSNTDEVVHILINDISELDKLVNSKNEYIQSLEMKFGVLESYLLQERDSYNQYARRIEVELLEKIKQKENKKSFKDQQTQTTALETVEIAIQNDCVNKSEPHTIIDIQNGNSYHVMQDVSPNSGCNSFHVAKNNKRKFATKQNSEIENLHKIRRVEGTIATHSTSSGKQTERSNQHPLLKAALQNGDLKPNNSAIVIHKVNVPIKNKDVQDITQIEVCALQKENSEDQYSTTPLASAIKIQNSETQDCSTDLNSTKPVLKVLTSDEEIDKGSMETNRKSTTNPIQIKRTPDSSNMQVSEVHVKNKDKDVELATGSGVFINEQVLKTCEFKSRNSPSMLMRFLLDKFFSVNVLSSSSAAGRGHAKRPPLNSSVTTALMAFIQSKYPDVKESALLQSINQKCTDARKIIRKNNNNLVQISNKNLIQ